MPYFVCKLIPPRPSFATDMTDAEAVAMAAHMAYWARLSSAGRVVVYGPVADPAGAYGLAVVEAPDLVEVEALTDADPAIQAGIGLRYRCAPMLQALIGRLGADQGRGERPN